MRPMLLIGVFLFVLGLVLAGVGMLGVADESPTAASGTSAVTGGQNETSTLSVGVPVLSGLALATGALLVGLSFGNWRNPRTHTEPGDEIVDPEGHDKMKHV